MFTVRLRKLREDKGYSQDDIGSLLGVSKQQYHRWETGKNKPSGETVTQLAKLFGVTTDYLLGRSDDPQERMTEDDLSTDELELLKAYRSGKIWKILRLIHQLDPEVTKGVYPPDSTSTKAK